MPSRFRKPRVLLIGYGDVAQRMAQLTSGRWRVAALIRRTDQLQAVREQGVTPLWGDLDQGPSLKRLAGWAQRVVHLAPPPGEGLNDPRTVRLLQALSARTRPAQLVYVSTTGVYGDAQGEWVRETRALNPQTERAQRRVHAEQAVRSWGRRTGVRVSVFRVPGIHAADRPGNLKDRLLRAAPVLVPEQDIYTNHIHADDLARLLHWAVWGALAQRAYNVNDATQARLGEALGKLADALGLPHPPTLTWEQAQATLSPLVLSFWRESRRIDAQRLHREWPWTLQHPHLWSAY